MALRPPENAFSLEVIQGSLNGMHMAPGFLDVQGRPADQGLANSNSDNRIFHY